MMRLLLILGTLGLFLFVSAPLWAADGDLVDCERANLGVGWGCQRWILQDSAPADPNDPLADSAILAPTMTHELGYPPWDFCVTWADASDACTDFDVDIRGIITQNTAQCEGACDSHLLQTHKKTGTTSKRYNTPLPVAFFVDPQTLTSCTVTTFLECFFRSHKK